MQSLKFSEDVRAFAQKVAGRANAIVTGTVIEVAKRVIDRSPVGDPSLWASPAPKGYKPGHFKGNWQLGIDTIPTKELRGVDPSGAVALSGVMAWIPAKSVGHVYNLVNNVPYANRIEHGWSTQAPAGVVGLVAVEFDSIVKGVIGKIGVV